MPSHTMMSHSPRDRSSSETMPAKPGPGPSEQRREKFLQRVVEQIEVDRLCRTLRKHFNAKETEDSPQAQRSLGRREVFRGQRDGCADDGADDRQASGHVHRRALKKHNGSPRSADSSPLPPSLDQHGRGTGNEARSSHRPNGKGKARKVPRITVESPRQEDAPGSEDRQVIHVPLSSCPSHRQTPSGPFYGVNSGHANPVLPGAKADKDPGPSRIQMFSWKICTPTNWKRAKSYHEILLERKLLRRNGRQPSQSQFYSVFALRDSRKVTARDRIRRVLRRARFYGDDIKRLPLLRFRRAVRTLIALLKTVKLSRDKGKGLEPSAWIDDDDFRTSRRAHGTLGITFDVFSYRARKEIQVSNEAKAILSMAPGTRSEEQQHVALVSLSQAVPEFGEFPIAMQEALVRVGWYENFEARRIIIREGHMADNFYLILSGSAVVTIREQNGSGDYFGRTAAVLQKGNSFGELALIYGGKRSATVTCKDTVELLAVGRDDYIDIFMHKTKDGAEPDHIKFLKQIKLFCGWPIHALPLDDPSVFLYTYVRRGMVLCKDSNKCEWIYVIKSGSCRVLTALQAVRPSIQSNDRWDHTKDVVPVSGAGGKHAEDRRCAPFLPPVRRVTPFRSRDHCSRSRGLVRVHTFTRTHRLPSINSRSDHEVKEAATKHLQQLDQIWKKRNTHLDEVNELPNGTSGESRGLADQSKQRSKSDRIFVNLQTLQAKDVYGLEPVVMSVFKQPTSTSLVSDGAECIMIHKRFFLQKLTEDVAKKIRKEIRPLPSVEVLQQKLQTKTDWDTYRAIAVADFVDFRKYVQDFLDV